VKSAGSFRLALLLLTAPATLATGQTPAYPWAIGVSAGWGPQFTGTYQHRFPATLADHPEASGAGGQDVRLSGETGNSLAASLTRMLGHHLGVQLVLAAARSPLGGPSSNFAWSLDYTSRQPPDYAPQPVNVTNSTPWPATDGRVRQLALAANVVFRYPLYERVSVSFSGGIAVLRFDGQISPLGVTLFSEGGHATLLPETYRVRATFGPNYAAGLDLGTEFAWRVGARLGLAFEVRYFAAPSVQLDPKVDRVLNSTEVVHQTTPAELNAQAPLERVEFDPSFGMVLLGVRYRI
jgi:hypothetical protein